MNPYKVVGKCFFSKFIFFFFSFSTFYFSHHKRTAGREPQFRREAAEMPGFERGTDLKQLRAIILLHKIYHAFTNQET